MPKIANYHESPLHLFLYWCQERMRIARKRQAGEPRPWTQDRALQQYFFTHPFRELDKSTVWLRENVRDPLADSPAVLFATLAFRWFNLPTTGERLHSHGLLTHWNTQAAKQLLHGFEKHGEQIFSGAYRIAPPMVKGDSKIDVVCDLLGETWRQRHDLVRAIEWCPTLEQAHERLMELPGVGPFVAYEFVSDLRWTYLLRDASDIMTWANMGPGAARGMNRLLGRPVSETCYGWLHEARKLLAVMQTRLAAMPKPHELEMREVEHSLCEFDKYRRALIGDGRMKRKFDGVGNGRVKGSKPNRFRELIGRVESGEK